MITLLLAVSGNAQSFLQIVEKDLNHRTSEKKLVVSDIVNWKVTSEHVSNTSGTHHVYFRQLFNGLEINGTESSIHILQDQTVLSSHNQFIKELEHKQKSALSPSLTATQAVEAVAGQLGYNLSEPLIELSKQSGVTQETLVSKGGISISNIPAKLMYQRLEDDSLVLVWDLSIEAISKQEWFSVRANAVTGEIIDKVNWTVSCNLTHTHNHDGSHSDFNFTSECAVNLNETPSYNNSLLTGSYRVFAMPVESPYFGSRTLETSAVNTVASPFGWHDTNGVSGPEFTVTRGNNVNAYEDGDNPGFQPDGGATLVFDFPFNQTYSSGNQSEAAAITNLFYWNNIIHDMIYLYGFDEASGNFQANNYGNGGIGNDWVRAEAQDGSGTCNANFSTPTDGSLPRMQMYVCGSQDGDFDSLVIVHEYGHGISIRLTGGAANSGCLSNQEQMGEGWSDWYGLLMTMQPGDTSTDSRTVGTYLFGQGPAGNGIRPFPYNTDLSVNPQTYDDIKTAAVPHGVGSVWSTMLWEMTWALIDDYGFDTDFYNGTGGNNIALALVTEALKIQPCSPGFVDGRDAILAADIALYGGANQCLIWDAFAKRGLGVSANQGSSNSKTDGTEAFDTPSGVAEFSAPGDVCEAVDVMTNLGGGSPAGGIYSGPGVTDNGNGSTFTFDPALAGVGVHTITYDLPASSCAVASSANDNIEVFEALIVTCQSAIIVDADPGSCGTIVNYATPSGVSGCSAEFLENFDMVTTPLLPSGWTFTQDAGTAITWATTNSSSSSAPNAVFANDPAGVNLSSLISPQIEIASTSAQLIFKNRYQTENTYDGMVLEYSLNGGASWQDILNGGGTFASGGYNGSLSTCCGNPLPGRQAWTGNSGGFIDTVVNLNASFDGETVQFRWRMGSDNIVSSTGVWIDDIQVLGIFSPEPTTTQIAGLASGDLFPVGTTTNTFEIEDGAGNIVTCTFDVTVNDTIDPLAIGQNIIVQLDGNGEVTITPADVDNGSSDNCGIDSFLLDVTNFTCDDLGENTVNLTVVDLSGNSSTVSVIVTVVDENDPILTCPADVTVQINSGSTFTVPDYFVNGDATATDNCTAPITVSSQTPSPGTELSDGTYTIEISVTDDSGNETSCSFELIVEELLSIDNQSLTENITIYPNPTSGNVTVLNNSNVTIQNIAITDVNGRLIQSLNVFENQQEIQLSLNEYATGLYFIKIATEQISIVKRIVKK